MLKVKPLAGPRRAMRVTLPTAVGFPTLIRQGGVLAAPGKSRWRTGKDSVVQGREGSTSHSAGLFDPRNVNRAFEPR